MASFVALLRIVSVGGTGGLVMADLKALCETMVLRPSVEQNTTHADAVHDKGAQ